MCLTSTQELQTLRWTLIRLPRAYTFALRLQKQNDPFRKSCFLHIGKGEFPLCAISSLLAYLALRGDASGPLLYPVPY